MADPVTLAAIGAVAGAATNKKDPIKGALLGAGLGFGGGTIAPALLGTGAAATAPAVAGFTPIGAQAAGALTGAGAAAASPGLGAALGSSVAPAAAGTAGTGFMAKAMTPATLIAAGNLATNLAPKPGPAITLPLRPGVQSPLSLEQIQAIQGGLFDTIDMDRRMTSAFDRYGRRVPTGYELDALFASRPSLL